MGGEPHADHPWVVPPPPPPGGPPPPRSPPPTCDNVHVLSPVTLHQQVDAVFEGRRVEQDGRDILELDAWLLGAVGRRAGGARFGSGTPTGGGEGDPPRGRPADRCQHTLGKSGITRMLSDMTCSRASAGGAVPMAQRKQPCVASADLACLVQRVSESKMKCA